MTLYTDCSLSLPFLTHVYTHSLFSDGAESRVSTKNVGSSSSQSSAAMVANASSDSVALEGKSRHPQPTPPLDDGKDHKIAL